MVTENDIFYGTFFRYTDSEDWYGKWNKDICIIDSISSDFTHCDIYYFNKNGIFVDYDKKLPKDFYEKFSPMKSTLVGNPFNAIILAIVKARTEAEILLTRVKHYPPKKRYIISEDGLSKIPQLDEESYFVTTSERGELFIYRNVADEIENDIYYSGIRIGGTNFIYNGSWCEYGISESLYIVSTRTYHRIEAIRDQLVNTIVNIVDNAGWKCEKIPWD